MDSSSDTLRIKYPRTFHLPWTGCMTTDDKLLDTLDFFQKELVASIKMDGENTTMYRDHIHARSIDGNPHWTQSWVRQKHAEIQNDIPKNWRICGENVYAQHSIKYDNLESYFYIFSIWDENNICLSWDETEEWSNLLDIPLVPVIFKGHWNVQPQKIHESIWSGKYNEDQNEGYVIRNSGRIPYAEFNRNVGKYVRPNHVTTDEHWKSGKIEKNTLNYE